MQLSGLLTNGTGCLYLQAADFNALNVREEGEGEEGIMATLAPIYRWRRKELGVINQSPCPD